ncbi:MAG: hypothetical protein GX654_00315 [Desulfatiglans sp.]|jgi:hypothetical protein|nr:hypothetical protein [Desulfatiglans sp.]
MKKTAFLLLTICLTVFICASVSGAQAGEASCTREALSKITDQYFESIQAHNTSGLPLSSTAKFTENGIVKEVGKGFWETAGKPLLKRTLIDTQKCTTATIAVIEEPFSSKTVGTGMGGGFGGGAAPGGAKPPAGAPKTFAGAKKPPAGQTGDGNVAALFAGPTELPKEGTVRPILFANRLKVENGKITEIETIIARERDFAFNPQKVLETKDQDWDTILPPEKRAPRKVLANAADNYFALFAEGSTASVPFAKVCDRWENGFLTTGMDHDCSPVTFIKRMGSSMNHGPRRVWVDTEKGISIAFMAFLGGDSVSEQSPTGAGLMDCHMFRVRDGEVDLIHSIVGPRAASMGWPLEPIE